MLDTGAWIGIASIIISAIVGPVCVALVNNQLKKSEKKADKKVADQLAEENKIREELKKERREEITEIVSNVIEAKIQPVSAEVKEIKVQLDKVSDGTLSTLRNDILKRYYECSDKKYRTDYDYENIHHLYESYHILGGNSFVVDIMKRFDALPTKEEYDAQKKKARSTNKKVVAK